MTLPRKPSSSLVVSRRLLVVAALAAVGWAWLESCCRLWERQITERLEQTRLVEARDVARRLAFVSPNRTLRGTPIKELIRDLDQQIQLIEWQTRGPLPSNTGPAARFDRARRLAALGDRPAARDAIAPALRDNPDDGALLNLRGTIDEHDEDWTASLASFAAARAAWSDAPDSDVQRAGLHRALRGMAFSLRKLGRMREAADAYAELLAHSPTAEVHFEAARFYEEAQQGRLAHEHASRAATIDPERYSATANDMTSRLASEQFDCFLLRQKSDR